MSYFLATAPIQARSFLEVLAFEVLAVSLAVAIMGLIALSAFATMALLRRRSEAELREAQAEAPSRMRRGGIYSPPPRPL